MAKQPTCTLIISTYNWPKALNLVLLSVLNQKQLPTEIVIADDGSKEETKNLIDSYRDKFPIPIKHVWHEDEGFRLAKIRNKAIATALGNYIIQIDGDVILHPYFIKDHLDFAKKNTLVRASRIYINNKSSEQLLNAEKYNINAFSKGVTNFFSALRLPFLWPIFEKNYKNKGTERFEIHGCNMAFWRKDAIAVNGYNENFNGWGPEDKEFVARLLNIGVQKRFLKMGAIVFHIYHTENSKNYLAENENEFKKTITENRTECSLGINQYLHEE